MELIPLGTAGWMPSQARETSAFLFLHRSEAILLDAGTGVRRLVTQPQLVAGLGSIDILLSHFHLDHVVGLGYLDGLDGIKIRIWGPGALLYGTSTSSILDRITSPPLLRHRLADFVESVGEVTAAGLTVAGIKVAVRAQAGHTAPSLAFRLGDLVAYCTDTEYDAGNVPFASGCAALLHEAWSARPPAERGHTSATEAAALALAAGVDRLWLVHLPPDRDSRPLTAAARGVFGATEVARDGTAIALTGNRR